MFAIGQIPYALRDIAMEPGYTPHTLTMLVLNWGGVIAVPVFGYSPFHLLWWFPAVLLVSCVVAGIFHYINGPGSELRKRKRAEKQTWDTMSQIV